jgi:hypothetical protein
LSVFIALILMGLSVATVSGHEDDENTPKAADLVSVEVVLNSDVESASPGDELKFQVTVLRIADGHSFSGSVTGPDGVEVIEAFPLDDDNPIKTAEVTYEIASTDLGAAVERTADLVWTFTLETPVTTDGDDTESHAVTVGTNDTATGSAEVTLIKRPGGDAEVVGVDLDFSGTTEPETLAKGEKVTFKLVVSTGDTYSLRAITESNWKSLVVVRQLFDADGEEVGNAIPSAVFTIPSLKTGSTSDVLESAPKTHALQTAEVDEIADGGKLVFSYTLTVNETDILKAGNVVDIDKDDKVGETSSGDVTAANVNVTNYDFGDLTGYDKVADLEGDILTLEMAAEVEAEPEATADTTVGSNDAATVEDAGSLIHIAFADGTERSIGVGALTTTGEILPSPNGFIRDDEYGQTYAVVRRASDSMIVRAWISSSNAGLVGDASAWTIVVNSYTFSEDVVNAIPLDGMHPADQQLVWVSGLHIYVSLAGEWWRIPDIPTFESYSYYWCDVTTADDRFEAFVADAPVLPSVGGTPTPGYPGCR